MITLTNIWKINNTLVVANSIEDAIVIYKTKTRNCSISCIEKITNSGSVYREERHPQYNYLGYSARRGDDYLQVKYTDLEIRAFTTEILFLTFIQQLDKFIYK